MRTFKFIALAVCVVTTIFVGCNNDEDDAIVKEYAFQAICDVPNAENEESMLTQEAIIEQAFETAGLSMKDFTLVLSGKDSIAVSKILLEKMAIVENTLNDSPVEINAVIGVKGAEKQYVNADNDKEHPCKMWYLKEIGTPTNGGITQEAGITDNNHAYRFVKFIRTVDSRSCGAYWTSIGSNLNYGAGGNHIRLALEHSLGSHTENTKFVMEPQYQYVTDVIAIIAPHGGEPNDIVINGRKYQKAQQVCDLNKGCSGDYIYLYVTYDYYDGYYLNTGGSNHTGCRTLLTDTSHYNVNSNSYLKAPYTVDGHKFVERVLQAYSTTGKSMGNAELNNDSEDKYKLVGIWSVQMILTYATK